MIGYLVEQELGNLLPAEHPDRDDGRGGPGRPGLRRPKVRRPRLRQSRGRRARRGEGLGREGGWRVLATRLPSPRPKRIFEIGPMRWLLDHGSVVIRRRRGIPTTMFVPGEERRLTGVEAVIDEASASSLLADELGADLFVMATDVDGVYTGWGTPSRPAWVTPTSWAAMDFAGSMGPKVSAAVEFVAATGKRAAIGSLEQIDDLIAGTGRQRRRDYRPAILKEHPPWRRPFRGRQAAPGPPAGPQPQPADARQPRRAAVRRRAWVERAQWEHDQFVARMRDARRRGLLRQGPPGRGPRRRRCRPPASSSSSPRQYVVGIGLSTRSAAPSPRSSLGSPPTSSAA